jgi:hypothetical protein
MRGSPAIAALLASVLAGCGSTGQLHLDLNSDDSQQGLAPPAVDLRGAASVRITVKRIDVHLADATAPASVNGDDVKDDDGGWRTVGGTLALAFDLIKDVRGSNVKPLADLEMPPSKVTQVRLVLAGGQTEGTDERYLGAVTDADGTACDLIVPHAAVDPGLKLGGTVQTASVTTGAKTTVVVNFPLKDSSRDPGAACAFRLTPALLQKK